MEEILHMVNITLFTGFYMSQLVQDSSISSIFKSLTIRSFWLQGLTCIDGFSGKMV